MTEPADETWQTESLLDRAAAMFGGETRSVSGGQRGHAAGRYPHFAVRAEGCRIWDTDGRCFIDWSMGWGAVALGYRHPAVEAAIRAQLEQGPLLSLMHPLEVEVAEQLVAAIPGARQVSFGKNGSDVVTAAVRIARAATGREVVLACGFHGFHDWFVPVFEQYSGTPKSLRDLVHRFRLNDLPGLQALFDRFRGKVAGVVVDPAADAVPAPGYLEEVRRLTRANGALLIFDEILTGFRLARGGAQEAFGVSPDLACYGKALANGMPLSALVGPLETMRGVPHVAFWMTFRGETLSLAAARAALLEHARLDLPTHLARIGTMAGDGFRDACQRAGVAGELLGPPARQRFSFAARGNQSGEEVGARFLRGCLEHGVLSSGGLLPSLAHDEAAVEQTVQAFGRSLESLG